MTDAKTFSAKSEASSPSKGWSWLPPRTASYVEALIREGDDFDYSRWLDGVRAPATEATEVPVATGTLHSPSTPDNRFEASGSHRFQRLLVPSRLGRLSQDPNGETPKARLERRVKKIRRSWDELQATRTELSPNLGDRLGQAAAV